MTEQSMNQKRTFWLFVLTGMLLVLTTSGFARMSYGAVLPYMQEDLSLSISQAGLIGTVMFLGYLVTVGLSGVLAFRWGAKAVLLAGGGGVLVSMLGLAWASSFWWVCLFMFVSGAGSALVFTPLMSVMIGWFPDKRGIALGIILSGAGIGMLLSGILTPLIMQQFADLSWRAVWIFFGLISLAVLLLAVVILKNPALTHTTDTQENKPQWLKNRELTKIALLYFLLGVSYLIPNLYQTSYMLENGFSSATAGWVYAVAGVFSIVGGPLWGGISDKIGAQKTLLAAWIFAVAGDLIPVLGTHIGGFILSAAIWGSSIGGLVTLIQVKASQQVPQRYVSAVIGFISVFYAVGQMMGPGLSGWISDHMGGFASAYVFGAIIYAAGLMVTLNLSKEAARISMAAKK
ncbi:MFS transporter [Desulforamulus ruminis]|uniref:Major facilitator superfamily MFS_1 n=1 Tax=Desulforamulus ruminis (strain ATCC 23193 / DSM 2154 / NCIMB 8452 / DL) TaxID=696281 RepID=F6DKP4_DESRL|nr:MFS transporter [Desulforamulus ruminis]AEG60419.1 major facilitator superfamily MFS_1 [Desulforamulus ruminis DSM 2154]